MNIKKYFPEEELNKATKILREFHNRLLLDSRINNPSAVILSTYMISNEKKEGFVEKGEVKKMFMLLGKTSDEFDKTLYEISGKRKTKTKFIDIDKNKIGLNFNGIEKIRNILNKK